MLIDHEIIEEKDNGIALIENLESGKFAVVEIDRDTHHQVKTRCRAGGWEFGQISDNGISYVAEWVSEAEARERFDTNIAERN